MTKRFRVLFAVVAAVLATTRAVGARPAHAQDDGDGFFRSSVREEPPPVPPAGRYGQSGIGFGLVLGEPTGITGKFFLTDALTIDTDLAFSFLDERFEPTIDLLYHFQNITPSSADVAVRPYLGGGAMLAVSGDNDDDKKRKKKDDDSVKGGVRATGGLSLIFAEIPIELAVDVSPGWWFTGDGDFDVSGAFSVRYFF